MTGSLFSGGVAHAATYYVSKTGSVNNSCAEAQSLSTPKLTVNGGIGCLWAGDTLSVRAGTYAENITSVPSGTSWSSKVRVAAYSGETVWLTPTTGTGAGHIIWLDCNCHYVEFDGIDLDGPVTSNQGGLWTSTTNGNNPHHVRLANAEVIAQGANNAIILGSHTLIGAIS